MEDIESKPLGPEPHRWRLPPPWLGNLLIFGALIGLTLTAFYLQTRAAERRFIDDAAEHARLLADAVRLHARGAVLAEQATDAIVTAFLGNSARFVAYLNQIEPFNRDELTAFAAESGLSMIRIVADAQPPSGPAPEPADYPPSTNPLETSWVQGPRTFLEHLDLPCNPFERLRRLPDKNGFLFSVPAPDGPGCAMVALQSPAVDKLLETIGLTAALATVAKLPGVLSARLEGQPGSTRIINQSTKPPPDKEPTIRVLRAEADTPFAEARTPIADAELVLLLEGGALAERRHELWIEFSALLISLLTAGALGTWLLLKVQHAHERQLLAYERRLSVQREEASLGRAAASIAHDIRNPLNTIALGLQRLQLEATELQPSRRPLITQLLTAVRRTDATVRGLLDYARPDAPVLAPVELVNMVRDCLMTHGDAIARQRINLQARLPQSAWIMADAGRLRRVLDNLLRNAEQALPEAGNLRIEVTSDQRRVGLTIANQGYTGDPAEIERLTEPWFTTRTDGTGLGLAIVSRIIQGHGGQLRLDSPDPGWLRVLVWLEPARPPIDPVMKTQAP